MTDTLPFILNIVDDWPPAAIESLPCIQRPEGWLVAECPLFIKGISVGDVISIVRDAQGYVESWRHVSKSNTSTIWLLRLAATASIEPVLENLRSIGCKTVQLPNFGSYAVEVPGDCEINRVDAVLSSLDPEKVAVAYPSFRHPE